MAIEDNNFHSRAASYQKLVREQTLAILGMDNFELSDQYYCNIIVFIEHMCLLNNRKEVYTY